MPSGIALLSGKALLSTSAVLASLLLAHAVQAEPTLQRPTPQKLRADAVLSAQRRGLALRIAFEAGAPLELKLPQDFEAALLKQEALKLDGVELLHVSFLLGSGSAQRIYEVWAQAGADRSAPPELLLKGELAKQKLKLTRVKEGGKEQLILASSETYCGLPKEVEVSRYSAQKRKFVSARQSLVDDKELTHAPLLPESNPSDSASLLTVERLGGSEDTEAWAAVQQEQVTRPFPVLLGQLDSDSRALHLELAAPTKDLWVKLEQKLYRLGNLSAGVHEFALPASESPRCMVLGAQAAQPGLSWAERRGQALPSDEELLAALGGEHEDLSLRALPYRRHLLDTILGAYSKLSPSVRARLPRLAQGLGRTESSLLALELALREQGETQAQALELLKSRADLAEPELLGRLERAQDVSARLALLSLLGQVSSSAGVRALSEQMEALSKATKLELSQRALRGKLRGLLEAWLQDSELRAELYTQAQLRPQSELSLQVLLTLPVSEPERTQLFELALGPQLERRKFEVSYRLLRPSLLWAQSRGEAERQTLISQLLSSGSSLAEAAALKAAYFSALETQQELTQSYGLSFNWKALSDTDPVVREAAARVLAVNSDRSLAKEAQLSKLLSAREHEPWPEVRRQLALALGQLSALYQPEQKRELEAKLGDFFDDEDPGVRAQVVRAWIKSGGPLAQQKILEVLRSSDLPSVRAEAARGAGALCLKSATQELAEIVSGLTAGVESEEQVQLGLAAVQALLRLAPPNLEQLLQPLTASNVPGGLRGQVERLRERVEKTCSP